ncbi:uncharacterized protein Z518_01232 [Rhinocladiella mackenziei CBS 650.93]|uniref:CRAL-TRIO domain-containing protein n=1 Tax=Rhinocladiella mackenziei CBS 650.93 TaxID=1442369 RepID=A0A0D2J394_9EURO|nr:uncharacterized protein Z518_01232 [Rhinocladiella mackenziei CBS 650.93]KIX10151.1 hypothetical protein Z518_01232 [Rhinocladiella mackenziei CBS 650.93]
MSPLHRTLTGQSHSSHHSDHSTQAYSTLTKTTTTDPLAGTLNHLTPVQEQKLEEFKDRLLKGGWWSPDGVNGKPSHDDGTLLRYLRARKFDINGAIGQFTDTEKWLKDQQVEELYDHFDVEAYEKARLVYPQWTGHRDKRGIPIYVYQIKGLDSKTVHKYQKESQEYKDSLPYHKNLSTPAKLIPLFALYQNLLNFVMPLVSTLERPNPEVPVTNSTNIVDISGVGLTQFWNLKGHMQDASILATAHYPETLDRIFIIGAPSFFPTVWGWIKRWFDPVTVSKIFILSKNDVKPTLSKFMDTKDFPKRYGGELDWECGDLPHLDDETRAALEKDGNKGWVRGPCLWLDGQRVAVGSENGKLRRPDSDIQKKKPIVCAADYTEVPVHPDRKLSIVTKSSTTKMANGTASPHHHAAEASAAAVADRAISAKIVESRMNPEQPPTPQLEPRPNSRREESQQELPNVPEKESEPPTTTETISVSSATPPTIIPQTTSTQEPSTVHPHPSAIPEPGPTPSHRAAMTQAVAEKLNEESVTSNPPTANGHAAPEVASDLTRGLPIETEKLAIVESTNGEIDRPFMERFVTATEV